MQLQKPKRETLSAQIVRQMEQCIEEGIWPVGSKIPSELELMEEFGVSRNTIREATLSLVHAGLLRSQRGGGTYVARSDRLDAVLQDWLKSSSLSEILETRLVLETAIVRYACQRSVAADRKKLQEVYLDRLNTPTDSNSIYTQVDKKFHLQVAKCCHNEILCGLYESFFSFLEETFAVFQSYTDDIVQNDEHESIYKAIVNGDEEAAVRAVNELIRAEEQSFKNAGLLQ